MEKSTFEDVFPEPALFNDNSTKIGEPQKKRSFSEAIDDEYESEEEEYEEEVEKELTPEEAQRRTDELIAKLMA